MAGSCARRPGARGRMRRTCVCSWVGARGHAAAPGLCSSCQWSGAGSLSEGPSAQAVAAAGGPEAAAETKRRGREQRMWSQHPNLLSCPHPNTGPRPSQGAAQPCCANAGTRGQEGMPGRSSCRQGLQKPLGVSSCQANNPQEL